MSAPHPLDCGVIADPVDAGKTTRTTAELREMYGMEPDAAYPIQFVTSTGMWCITCSPPPDSRVQDKWRWMSEAQWTGRDRPSAETLAKQLYPGATCESWLDLDRAFLVFDARGRALTSMKPSREAAWREAAGFDDAGAEMRRVAAGLEDERAERMAVELDVDLRDMPDDVLHAKIVTLTKEYKRQSQRERRARQQAAATYQRLEWSRQRRDDRERTRCEIERSKGTNT